MARVQARVFPGRHVLLTSPFSQRFFASAAIDAPSSTKSSKKERDPEMHQTRKGNQWFFSAKAHIGVASKEGIVHSVCTSAL
jgi:IS5 family transposase